MPTFTASCRGSEAESQTHGTTDSTANPLYPRLFFWLASTHIFLQKSHPRSCPDSLCLRLRQIAPTKPTLRGSGLRRCHSGRGACCLENLPLVAVSRRLAAASEIPGCTRCSCQLPEATGELISRIFPHQVGGRWKAAAAGAAAAAAASCRCISVALAPSGCTSLSSWPERHTVDSPVWSSRKGDTAAQVVRPATEDVRLRQAPQTSLSRGRWKRHKTHPLLRGHVGSCHLSSYFVWGQATSGRAAGLNGRISQTRRRPAQLEPQLSP